MNRVLTFIVLIVVFASCERYEDVELDVPYKPKIVTACFLQGQSAEVQVSVTRSLPVFNAEPRPQQGFEPTPEYIKDASVMLQQGSSIYFLTFDPISNLYVTTLPAAINANEHYDLTVISGNETSKGGTTVPGKVNTTTQFTFDSILQTDGTYQYRATVSCTLLDQAKTYIDLIPLLYYNDSNIDQMYSPSIGTIEELNPGQTVTKTFLSSFSAVGVSPARFELFVVNCDEGYAQNTNRIFNSFGGYDLIPFLEPTTTYSNMNGGVGIIGSYNIENRYTFILK